MSDIRSQVLRCSTEGLHGGSVGDAFFAEAKICDLNVSVFVQHEVLQLIRRTREIKHMNLCFWILHAQSGCVSLLLHVKLIASNPGEGLPSDHDRRSWQNVGSLEQRRSQRHKTECGPPKKLFLLTNGKTASKKKNRDEFIHLRYLCGITLIYPVKTHEFK